MVLGVSQTAGVTSLVFCLCIGAMGLREMSGCEASPSVRPLHKIYGGLEDVPAAKSPELSLTDHLSRLRTAD